MRRTLAAAAALTAVMVACNTPTLPVPPPAPPDPEHIVVAEYAADPTKLIFQADRGDSEESSIPPGAVVTIFDETSGYGTIVTADGAGEFVSDPFTGEEGDRVVIRYVDEEGVESEELCVDVQIGPQSGDNVCAVP